MGDYYIQNRTELKGQPKRTIADYAEANGILVPKRFDTLKEARESGMPVIARSEHEQEYDGASGILYSKPIEIFPEATDDEDFKEKLWKLMDETTATHKIYCKLMRIEQDKFKEGTTFSYWQLMQGWERKIVVDSAINGRYHIMTTRLEGEDTDILSYVIYDNGKVIEFIRPLTDNLRDGLTGLIEKYENIKNLDRFDRNHCPVMEFITSEDLKNYFLQYHRTRDFEASKFALERAPKKDEIEVPFVRGATNEYGETLKITEVYADIWKKEAFLNLLDNEEGSFDEHHNWIFTEIMSGRRQLQIIDEKVNRFALTKVVTDHVRTSALFKPKISVIMDAEKLKKYEHEFHNLWKKAKEACEDQHINVHIVSDGRKAYVKRAD